MQMYINHSPRRQEVNEEAAYRAFKEKWQTLISSQPSSSIPNTLLEEMMPSSPSSVIHTCLIITKIVCWQLLPSSTGWRPRSS